MPTRYRRNWNTTPKQRQASARRFMTGASKAVNIASRALTVAKGVASLINTEKKYFDTIAVSSGLNTSVAIQALTAIPQGVTGTTRVGNEVKATSLLLRYFLKWNSTTVVGQRARIMLVRDLSEGVLGSSVTINNILQYSSTAQQLMESPLNMDYGKRFQMLFDHVYCQNTQVGGVYKDFYYNFAPLTKQTNKVSRKTNPHIRWYGVNGTDYDFGHVYMIVIGDQPSGSFTSTIEYMSRLRFIDN